MHYRPISHCTSVPTTTDDVTTEYPQRASVLECTRRPTGGGTCHAHKDVRLECQQLWRGCFTRRPATRPFALTARFELIGYWANSGGIAFKIAACDWPRESVSRL